MNGTTLPQHEDGPLALKKLHTVLLGLHEEELVFEIVEPVLIITRFSNCLDILVHGMLIA